MKNSEGFTGLDPLDGTGDDGRETGSDEEDEDEDVGDEVSVEEGDEDLPQKKLAITAEKPAPATPAATCLDIL